MQKIQQQAFITIPNMQKIKEHLQNDKQKKLPFNLKCKINQILKGFTNKQLLLQACKNISLPNNFISASFIESISQDELPKIYAAFCTLKKQMNRIHRHAGDTYYSAYTNILTDKNVNRNEVKLQQRQKQLIYLKRELTPNQIIKLALEDELKYREKLQNREKRYEESYNLKKKILEKKKQIAKKLNKKAHQIYSKQKQKQQKYYDEIQDNFGQYDAKNFKNNNQNNKISSQSKRINRSLFKDSYDETELISDEEQLKKIPFEEYYKVKEQKWKMKQKMFTAMRIKRKNSLSEKFMRKDEKAESIRLRRYHYNQEEQYFRLRKIIQKQKKFKGELKNSKEHQINEKNEDKSQQSQHQIKGLKKTNIHGYTFYGKKNNFFQYNEQKENIIKQKLNKINSNKQFQLGKKIDKVKDQLKKEELRRQKYQNNRFKLIEESNRAIHGQRNDSLIQQGEGDPQQSNIKQKHLHMLASSATEQTILKLRRQPKSLIQEKLNSLKQEQTPVNLFLNSNSNMMKFL